MVVVGVVLVVVEMAVVGVEGVMVGEEMEGVVTVPLPMPLPTLQRACTRSTTTPSWI
jgi:hypothetical protein